MSREIADKLRLKLTGAEKKKLRKRTTRTARPTSSISRAAITGTSAPRTSLRRGIAFFREAIESDPSFAQRVRRTRRLLHHLATNIPLPPHEAMPKAKAAAMKAIEIDDGLAEAWASLGAVRWWFDWDWEGAEEAYRRAIDAQSELRHRARRLRDAPLRARAVRRGDRADHEGRRSRSAVADHRRARGMAVLLRARFRIGDPAIPQGARARRELHPRAPSEPFIRPRVSFTVRLSIAYSGTSLRLFGATCR